MDFLPADGLTQVLLLRPCGWLLWLCLIPVLMLGFWWLLWQDWIQPPSVRHTHVQLSPSHLNPELLSLFLSTNIYLITNTVHQRFNNLKSPKSLILLSSNVFIPVGRDLSSFEAFWVFLSPRITKGADDYVVLLVSLEWPKSKTNKIHIVQPSAGEWTKQRTVGFLFHSLLGFTERDSEISEQSTLTTTELDNINVLSEPL